MKKMILFLYLFTICSVAAQTTYRLDSLHIFDWDNISDQWKHNTRELYSYSNGGVKETHLLRLVLNTAAEWENFYQFNKEYNADNNLTESIQQTWDNTSAIWQNSARTMNTYDGQNIDLATQYIFLGIDWQLIQENDFTYDGLDNIIEDEQSIWDFVLMTKVNDQRSETTFMGNDPQVRIEQEWITALNDWQNDERSEFFYDTGQLSRAEERTWVVGSSTWSEPFKQQLFFYNSNDLVAEIVNQNSVGGVWINADRIVQVYDANNNILEITSQEWSNNLGVWENSTRQLRTFDVNNNETELIFENWNALDNEWVGFLRILNFWSPSQVLSISNEEIESISVYPNPTEERIYIRSSEPLEKASLYNLLGKEILQVKNVSEINLAALLKGVYFLKAKIGNELISKKIILN